jgi:uncharacterized protein
MLHPCLQTPWRTLKSVPRRLLVALGNACRFEPSCSAYALQALQRHGAAKGTWLTAGRLLRCNPYCAGGCDPVPNDFKNPAAGLFSRLGLNQVDSPADRSVIRK